MTQAILHVGKYFPPYRGGMESFLADLMVGLEAKGVVNAALVHSADTGGGDWEGASPRVLRVPSHGRLLYSPVSPTFLAYLDRAIREVSPDVLHFHMPNPSAFWALASSAAKRLPWVIHWHSDVLTPASSALLKIAYRPYRLLEAAMLRRASAVIATSPNYLQTSPPLSPFIDKCEVIPLGIDDSRLPEPSEEEKLQAAACWPEQAALKLLVVGRFTYYKGHRTLLEALCKVTNAVALLAGSGELQGEMMAYATRAGLGARTKFIGNVSEAELAALYATADVVCLPALDRAEAFGMVLLEAMRYEKALIASNIHGSGVPWVLEQCECGVSVVPGDAESLAGAMQWLSKHPERRLEMARRGMAVYRETFKIEAVAEKVAALYRRVLA